MNEKLIEVIRDNLFLLVNELKELRKQQKETEDKLLSIAHGIDFLQNDFEKLIKS